MNVNWIAKERPPTNEWGVSKQLVLLTSKGSFATGYYLKQHDIFLTESFLLNNENVVAWMRGLHEAQTTTTSDSRSI